jgi:methylthioribose-1-phosphate isomerase
MQQKKENDNIMNYDTVRLDDENNAIIIIDQTKLPGSIELIALKTAEEIWDAIYLLRVRGAPAIGVAAAFGIYLLAKQSSASDYDTFHEEFVKQKEYLDSARPTAVNLSWALNRMQGVLEAHAVLPIKGKGTSNWGYAVVPLVGPVIGAIVAVLLYGAIPW